MNKSSDYKVVTMVSILLLLVTFTAIGQVKLQSSYSRFGLGDINHGYNVYQSSLGGASYGVVDPYRISSINPASYAKIDTGSFVFNAAFDGAFMESRTTNESTTSNYFNMNYFNVAFPITGWWRTSIGLLPYSTVGYDLNSYTQVDSIGDVRLGYIGDGGITEVYWGNAFNIFKGLSVGVNTSFLFGGVNLAQESELLDISLAFKYRVKSTTDLRAFHFNFGIQYDTKFGKNEDYFLGLGFVYSPEQSLLGKGSSIGITYTGGGDGFEYVKDTIFIVDNGSGSIVIPLKIGGGFSIGKTDKWMFAFDATFDEYSRFKILNGEKEFSNSLRYNVGGQYYVGSYALNFGANYSNSYLTINETDINEIGISFGVGFPLKSTKFMISYIDLAVEAGRRGTTSNNLIEQDFIKVKLGINIRNTWFRRPKYL
ncbi:MAG: hypothetical protein DRI86_12005 [Bacteroidetes bacterium]|nr:MAG: hypothetical protein DRI86_12005 [Bacteroidota bacterium]